MSSLHDPYDLLGASTTKGQDNIIPVLPQPQLQAMMDAALTHKQLASVVTSRTKSYRLYGGVAVAACLLLLLVTPLLTGTQPSTTVSAVTLATQATTPDYNASDIEDFSDMVMLAALDYD